MICQCIRISEENRLSYPATPLGNLLSKTVCDFWLNRTTFGGFQGFMTDLRSIIKSSNSIKPNLSPYNTKVTLSFAPY